MDLFVGVPDEETMETYIEFFATVSSMEQVDRFLNATKGKHFEVIEDGINTRVKLVDGEAITPTSCCRCWKAWVASFTYLVASGMTCTAIGTLGGAISGGVGVVSGFVCSGVFWAIEKLPNFDASCRRR